MAATHSSTTTIGPTIDFVFDRRLLSAYYRTDEARRSFRVVLGKTSVQSVPDQTTATRDYAKEQTLFCRNKLSASYPADVILQQKQMEAALVSFNDSLGHNYYRFVL
jgi:hypothetical protein